MNIYDSQRIAGMLRPFGYRSTSFPKQADLIILNTCTIREKAEQKAYSMLGRFTSLKRTKPDLIVGVGGCVAQQEGKKILDRVTGIDFVFGTNGIDRLPEIIERIESTRCRAVDIEMSGDIQELQPESFSFDLKKATGFVTIMRGCENFCSYCMVPYVRGNEISRPPEKILNEIKMLVDTGVREVTLLGQNVNSYGKKNRMCTFPELLSRVNRVEGLFRIRFTTSHPVDLSDDLIDSFDRLEKLCNHIHLPVQSGSDRILKKMNRRYTREMYLEKVNKLRKCKPDIAISTDIIVGFPGETETDFENSLELIQHVQYDSLFAFKYSDRPNAPAARFPDKLPELQKKERLQRVLDLQEQITSRKNQEMIGSTELVLVEGNSKKQRQTQKKDGMPPKNSNVQWTGRTSTNKIVNFIQGDDCTPSDETLIGKLMFVRIEKSFPHSLWGRSLRVEPTAFFLKGEENYAA